MHRDGGPIADGGESLLAALTPVPLPDGHDFAERTIADVESAAWTRGWRIVSGAVAARALLAAGYALGDKFAAGHLLYLHQATDATWITAHRYTRHAFVARPAPRLILAPDPEATAG